jgi:hypothetical protein
MILRRSRKLEQNPGSADQNSKSETPLSLSQVLEEEYVKLHNQEAPVHADQTSEEQRLKTIYRLIHALPQKRAALCLSGGGIRSATFALGVLQGFARCGAISRFDYLSTVSGGGYIGGWLTAWAHRHGINRVTNALTATAPTPDKPEPIPVRHLRDYTNYLNPKLGWLSADLWTLLGTILRNLLLNWLILIPLLTTVLLVPRLCVAVIHDGPKGLATLLLFVGLILLLWAVIYIGRHRPSGQLLGGDQIGFLKWCFLPLIAASIFLVTYWAWKGDQFESPTFFNFTPLGQTIPIRKDLLLFVGIGLCIKVIAFLSGIVFRRRRIQSLLLETMAVFPAGALGGYLVWCVAHVVFPDPLKDPTTLLLYVSFSAPAFLTALLLAETVFIGLTSYVTSDHDLEWWARSGAWFLIYIVVWSMVSSLLIFGPMGILASGTELKAFVTSLGGLAGIFTIMAGRSPKTPSKNETEGTKTESRLDLLGILIKYLLAWAPTIFATFLIIAISLGADVLFNRSVPQTWEEYRSRIINTPLCGFLLFLVGIAVLGLLAGIFVNINKFSLHGMYRNRLIRAYLGASRENRDPNLFTGFDDRDNIPMHELWPNRSPPHNEGPRQPFHILNIALNLVAGEKLAWQQRKAESFTVSPLHCGSSDVGYRRTSDDVNGKPVYYGGKDGISLGTAMAISGAAASPNMGYHSSPLVTFLMTLFNARLGWWLGNPGYAGRKTYKRSGPLFAARPMIAEALGLTNDKNKYVYLSDGGHFENLGLYEMVRRRCHTIFVVDASQDGDFKFEDLGGAVR